MTRTVFLSAACALCVVLLAGSASAATMKTQNGEVYLPASQGDFSGMILSLMSRQVSLLAGKEGVETDGTAANVLATLANSLITAQQAFVTAANTKRPQVDPIPKGVFDLINTSPYGAELAAAFNALPNIPDPLSFGTANFSGGTYNRGPAFNGSAQFVTFGARVFQYNPCFFSGTENFISIAPAALSVTPRFIYSAPYGIAVEPRAIEVLPRFILIKPVGINVTPVKVAVSPRFISIAPKVAVAPARSAG